MKIVKKAIKDISREDAHSGEGARRLYIDDGELSNQDFSALTYGYLPAGSKFSWHSHQNIEEVMLVIKGEGIVRVKDGEYEYKNGDLFIFPADAEHEIENTSKYENEFVFIRIKNKIKNDK